MKIIHTSDWHLGKKTEGKSRLAEQERALDELIALVKEVKADAVIVAGDIFDTVNPPAEAESLFYAKCLNISRLCPVIAIAGNHDNPERLSAPYGIANACNIILGGGSLDYAYAASPFSGGEGFVALHKGSERVNFALLPYPSLSRMSQMGYIPQYEKYEQNVGGWLSLCARGFTKGDCNITVSHLFMASSVKASDEAELGTAAILPVSVLPEAHYTALGHIHKPQCVSKSKNVYYSGSLLSYSFDDGSDKFFNILDTSAAGVTVNKIPVKSGKKLVTVTCNDYDACISALKDNPDSYVRILYNSSQPLSATKYAEMRGFDCFTYLKSVCAAPAEQSAPVAIRSDGELFADFYRQFKGEEPSEELKDMFEKAMRGEEL